ncbi:MAG: response regulator transcription factor [Clostridiales bacterium]|jgi:DNA-binding response OmpR family regulator|nr:response regulator transcription factor [Clostridiales bacterium]
MRVLLVEDERRLADALVTILRKNKITADHAARGDEGLDCALSGIYDVILLDIMLPRMDGLEILKRLRREDKTTPVIMLTARGEIPDRVAGLDCGADDYIPKPFSADELLARIRAVSRRKTEIVSENSELKYGGVTLSTHLLRLSAAGGEVALTLKECELLEYFINNAEIIVSKERIIEKIWGYDSEADVNHVEVYVSFLRKKLAHIGAEAVITTIRGAGYRLCLKN